MQIKVSIVDEDQRIRESLATLINGSGNIRCVSSHASGEEALRRLPLEKPQVVLMDINLPNMSGIECTRQLTARLPKLQVLMLTMYEDDDLVFQAMMAGASGYLVKRTSPAEILAAIEEVHSGAAPMSGKIARSLSKYFHELERATPERRRLAKREQEILDLLAKGYGKKEIAEALAISFETVGLAAKNIYAKLRREPDPASPERGINRGGRVGLCSESP